MKSIIVATLLASLAALGHGSPIYSVLAPACPTVTNTVRPYGCVPTNTYGDFCIELACIEIKTVTVPCTCPGAPTSVVTGACTCHAGCATTTVAEWLPCPVEPTGYPTPTTASSIPAEPTYETSTLSTYAPATYKTSTSTTPSYETSTASSTYVPATYKTTTSKDEASTSSSTYAPATYKTSTSTSAEPTRHY